MEHLPGFNQKPTLNRRIPYPHINNPPPSNYPTIEEETEEHRERLYEQKYNESDERDNKARPLNHHGGVLTFSSQYNTSTNSFPLKPKSRKRKNTNPSSSSSPSSDDNESLPTNEQSSSISHSILPPATHPLPPPPPPSASIPIAHRYSSYEPSLLDDTNNNNNPNLPQPQHQQLQLQPPPLQIYKPYNILKDHENQKINHEYLEQEERELEYIERTPADQIIGHGFMIRLSYHRIDGGDETDEEEELVDKTNTEHDPEHLIWPSGSSKSSSKKTKKIDPNDLLLKRLNKTTKIDPYTYETVIEARRNQQPLDTKQQLIYDQWVFWRKKDQITYCFFCIQGRNTDSEHQYPAYLGIKKLMDTCVLDVSQLELYQVIQGKFNKHIRPFLPKRTIDKLTGLIKPPHYLWIANIDHHIRHHAFNPILDEFNSYKQLCAMEKEFVEQMFQRSSETGDKAFNALCIRSYFTTVDKRKTSAALIIKFMGANTELQASAMRGIKS